MPGPREPVKAAIAFEKHLTAANIDTRLAASEAIFADLTPGARKRVIRAEEPATKTPRAVVYLPAFRPHPGKSALPRTRWQRH